MSFQSQPQSSHTLDKSYWSDSKEYAWVSSWINCPYRSISKWIHRFFGFSADLFFGNCKCIIVTPTLAAGWYVDGNEIKLGNRIEFRSGGDIYYRFRNKVRIGVGVYHISNAGIGDNNPGTEQVILKYQIPF